MKTASQIISFFESSRYHVGQVLYWTEPTDKYKLKVKIIKVQTKGSPGMGMGSKPLDSDVYTVQILQKSPRGNQYHIGDEVFSSEDGLGVA